MAQPINPQLAYLLLKEGDGWFGSPALLRTTPNRIDPKKSADLQCVLDGRIRIEALGFDSRLRDKWMAGKFDHLVFPERWDGIWSHGNPGVRRLLPRQFALAQHYDRAWKEVPDEWRTDIGTLQTFLNLPLVECMKVWSCRFDPEPHRTKCFQRHNGKIVARIRARLQAADEGDFEFTIEELRRLIE